MDQIRINTIKVKALIALILILTACSGNKRQLKNGVLIENRINRGINYEDPNGEQYNIRFIPITITNDSTIPINIQIEFLKEYYNHQSNIKEKFKLIPMPREWALDGIDITEKMMDELQDYIDKPKLNKTIEPGEKFVFAVGALYARPTKSNGILPQGLFVIDEAEPFKDCAWPMENEGSSNNTIPIGIRILFGEKCAILYSGQISYNNY